MKAFRRSLPVVAAAGIPGAAVPAEAQTASMDPVAWMVGDLLPVLMRQQVEPAAPLPWWSMARRDGPKAPDRARRAAPLLFGSAPAIRPAGSTPAWSPTFTSA